MNRNLKKEKRFYKINSNTLVSSQIQQIYCLYSNCSVITEGEEEMQLKKTPFILSFALSTLLVVGTTGFASGSDSDRTNNMMNANENGMTNMMENGNMSNMMSAMNSAEAKEMMNTCASFMKTTVNAKEAE